MFSFMNKKSKSKNTNKKTQKTQTTHKIITKDKDIIDINIKTQLNDECIICLENIQSNDRASLLKCGHIYHQSCIYEWFHKKKICPICYIEIKI